MLEFRFHTIELGPNYYLFLPKLNGLQLRAMTRVFSKKGYTIEGTDTLIARNRGATIRINSAESVGRRRTRQTSSRRC